VGWYVCWVAMLAGQQLALSGQQHGHGSKSGQQRGGRAGVLGLLVVRVLVW
jgi:hypothetical protein